MKRLLMLLILACVLWGQAPQMQMLISKSNASSTPPALVGTPVTASNATGSPITTLSTAATNNTTGNLIAVYVRSAENSPTTTVADTALNTYTPRTLCNDSGGSGQWFYAANITGNASNVVAITTTSAAYVAMYSFEYSGLSTTVPYDTESCSNNTGTSITSGTFTTTAANEVLLLGINQAALGAVYTGTNGYTIQLQDPGGISGVADKIVSSIQTGVTATATSDQSAAWIASVMTLKQ